MSLATLAPGVVLPDLSVPPIGRTTLALFAGASGDHMPLHIDIDAAREAGQPDVFAHGMLSMAYLGRLLTGWVPQQRIRSLSVRFTAITPLHSAPTCSGVVLAVENDTARIALTVTLPDGAITLSGEAVVSL
jgi:acyl dehydratase